MEGLSTEDKANKIRGFHAYVLHQYPSRHDAYQDVAP